MKSIKPILTVFVCAISMTGEALGLSKEKIFVSFKQPGNPTITCQLDNGWDRNGILSPLQKETVFPLEITRKEDDGKITVCITAKQDVYIHYSERLSTRFQHMACDFLMPGFWYRHNLRSPKEAPSFHTSDSWTVREDRLSSPMTVIYNKEAQQGYSILRTDKLSTDCLGSNNNGEILLNGTTSLGYTGFENIDGNASFAFGFPYQETPKSYIRKLTLAPQSVAFQYLKTGETITLHWEIKTFQASDFSACVQHAWEYAYNYFRPEPVTGITDDSSMKKSLSRYFEQSYVSDYPLHYFSGQGLKTMSCERNGDAEVGFIGRTLLNAVNALQYGNQIKDSHLINISQSIFDTYLQHGFTPEGFFCEVVSYPQNQKLQELSIRRQSEGTVAALHYLAYKNKNGIKQSAWESRMRLILNNFIKLQKEDGSFPRKFKSVSEVVEGSAGCTPTVIPPLVMGYHYFKDRRYLIAAKKAFQYVEKEIISKADYFSCTLDANCEDKEASLSAATAAYCMALGGNSNLRAHYIQMAKRATYFALSWYYMWDVPFAKGQMLGDLGFQSRGWGNVSTENNHIDVFVFDFLDVLRWLSKETSDSRFSSYAEVISTSMRQLLPTPDNLHGIAKEGYYPEVVQHTTWDYGKNGKGFYNDYFAPGWTVASLWEMLSPQKMEEFFK